MRTSSSVVALTPLVYMSVAAARTIRSRVAKPRLVSRRGWGSPSPAREMAATLGPEALHVPSLDLLVPPWQPPRERRPHEGPLRSGWLTWAGELIRPTAAYCVVRGRGLELLD